MKKNSKRDQAKTAVATVEPNGEASELTGLTALTPTIESSADSALPNPLIDQADEEQELDEEQGSDAACELTDFDFLFHKDRPVGPQVHLLCKELANKCSLYHTPEGRIVQLKVGMPPRPINDATDLEAVIRENFSIGVLNKGRLTGYAVPPADLKILLRSTKLQRELPVVDKILSTITYNHEFQLTKPGYNPGPEGECYFYTGLAVIPADKPVRLLQFLTAMSSKTDGDKANAAALAVTVILRHRWPGGKPIALITANKSHAGKDTVADFATGNTAKIEIGHHFSDWALQNEAVAALADPNLGVLVIGNIRTGASLIESAFLERTITSPKGLMQSSKRRGDGYERVADYIIMATANNGRFSADLANRGLPIDLELIGDVHIRDTGLGDPRRDFLPRYRGEIEAEVCGMIEKWKDQGCPMDETVKHPMKAWAATVGGILKANGIEGFLSNWNQQRNANDATREALGLLADAAYRAGKPNGDRWYRVSILQRIARDEGILDELMERRHRQSEKSEERQLGVILSSHRDETVFVEDDAGVRSYVIRKDRNSKTGAVATVYKFQLVRTIPIEKENPVACVDATAIEENTNPEETEVTGKNCAQAPDQEAIM